MSVQLVPLQEQDKEFFIRNIQIAFKKAVVEQFGPFDDEIIPRDHVTAFTSMIVCENCGKKYRRKIKRDEAFWQCSTYLKLGKKECHAKQIPEDILMTETAAVLGEPEFDEWLFKELIQEIRVPAFNHLVYVFKDGTKVEREWKDKSRRDSWTDEMRAQAAVHARRRYA